MGHISGEPGGTRGQYTFGTQARTPKSLHAQPNEEQGTNIAAESFSDSNYRPAQYVLSLEYRPCGQQRSRYSGAH